MSVVLRCDNCGLEDGYPAFGPRMPSGWVGGLYAADGGAGYEVRVRGPMHCPDCVKAKREAEEAAGKLALLARRAG